MYQTLPGFRDFPPSRFRQRNRIFRILRDTAALFGFEEFDGPVLEPLDLYVDKSGAEIVDQLFWFEDRGGRKVALRPEMTPTLARMAGGAGASLRKPVRWFSLNEQYRFERPQKGRQRSFSQFNLDILGEPDLGADAEIISCFASALERCGLGPDDFVIRLSDRRLWSRFLDLAGVAPEHQGDCLSVIDKIERLSPEKMSERIEPILGPATAKFLERVGELRSIRDEESLLPFFDDLGGDVEETRVSAELVDSWKVFRSSINALGLADCARLDLGIVRGLAYYTGPVFEIFEASGKSRALAGGGRYDDLVARISGAELEATGGALGDVTLLDSLEDRGLLAETRPAVDCFVAISGATCRNRALSLVREIRAAGLSCLYVFREGGFGKQFKEANRSGAMLVISVGEREIEEEIFPLKDLTTGEERKVPAGSLAEFARSVVRGG